MRAWVGGGLAYVCAGFDFYAFGRGATEGDPINQQTAALWHPLQSFPDQNNGRDDAHTMLTREQVSSVASCLPLQISGLGRW